MAVTAVRAMVVRVSTAATRPASDPGVTARLNMTTPRALGTYQSVSASRCRRRRPATSEPSRRRQIFGLDDPAHQQVAVHPRHGAGHARTRGQRRRTGASTDPDPANRAKSYPHTDDVIYAHEYGHMLGIPDEYSHCNEQLNAPAPPGRAEDRSLLAGRARRRSSGWRWPPCATLVLAQLQRRSRS